MILITLGTQDKQFTRLLKKVQKAIDQGIIKEEVIVQAGYTKFVSKDMKIFKLIPMDDFDKLISDCDILITHGGVGSIITGLKNNKRVIACARLAKYGEHENDHQLQIIDKFKRDGYIIGLGENDNFKETLTNTKKFNSRKFNSNTDNFLKLIKKYIESN